MSKSPEGDFDLELHFLPAWAQQPPDPNRYAKYQGEAGRPERRGDQRERRPWRREETDRPRRESGRRGQPEQGAPRGRDQQRVGWRGDKARPEPREQAPLPELNVAFKPDEKGVESLARQIKITGRAYPLFDIAQMILNKPERHAACLSVKKKPDGQPAQPLFVCALDDTLWLSQDEAVHYVLDRHFGTFYQVERTQTEGPKGTYTFVAQCGMSGTILGPPNHHDYQNQLRKLHSERFAHMPLESYKARVRIVRDEAVVKKWIDEQSWRTEYVCLNMAEPLKLGSREAVEQHFREVHLSNIIKQVESFELSGIACRGLRVPGLSRLLRHALEEQRRFPLQIATVLSQQFATHGLQFFKVNRSITHVAVARPRYLDLEAAPVSESVKRIVSFVNTNPKSTRRQLVEALAPAPPQPAKTEGAAPPSATPEASASAEPAEPTPIQTAVVADLHWLIHQGHVIEFANGILETAKKPAPRPEKRLVPADASQPSADGEPTSQPGVALEPQAQAELPVTPAPDLGVPPEEPVGSLPMAAEVAPVGPEPEPFPASPPAEATPVQPSDANDQTEPAAEKKG